MGKIYSLPTELEKKVPTFNFKDPHIVTLQKENDFIEEVRKTLVKLNPTQEFVGEEIKFPVADGYARYLVVSSKPVGLLHLPLGDAWDFQYANRVTKADIAQQIEANKRLAEMIAKKKEGQ